MPRCFLLAAVVSTACGHEAELTAAQDEIADQWWRLKGDGYETFLFFASPEALWYSPGTPWEMPEDNGHGGTWDVVWRMAPGADLYVDLTNAVQDDIDMTVPGDDVTFHLHPDTDGCYDVTAYAHAIGLGCPYSGPWRLR